MEQTAVASWAGALSEVAGKPVLRMDGGKGNQGRAGGGADSGPGLSRVRDGQSTRPHRSYLMQSASIIAAAPL